MTADVRRDEFERPYMSSNLDRNHCEIDYGRLHILRGYSFYDSFDVSPEQEMTPESNWYFVFAIRFVRYRNGISFVQIFRSIVAGYAQLFHSTF